MQIRLSHAFFIFMAGSVLLLGNKNGRAASQGEGNTGAPGDEKLSNNTALTCLGCHNSSAITASMGIALLDADNQPVDAYKPGQTYTARVTITATGTNLKGYGFQMIALRSKDNVDLKGFRDPGGNNYKLATISNGRTYAEHDNASTTNQFNVTWVAPAAGSGSVVFYAAGNGVNLNGNSSGDGASVTKLEVQEASTTAAADETVFSVQPLVSPNPVQDEATLRFQVAREGRYLVRIFDLNGRAVSQQTLQLQSGEQNVPVSMTDQPKGVYYARISAGADAVTTRFVKI